MSEHKTAITATSQHRAEVLLRAAYEFAADYSLASRGHGMRNSVVYRAECGDDGGKFWFVIYWTKNGTVVARELDR